MFETQNISQGNVGKIKENLERRNSSIEIPNPSRKPQTKKKWYKKHKDS